MCIIIINMSINQQFMLIIKRKILIKRSLTAKKNRKKKKKRGKRRKSCHNLNLKEIN